MRPEKMSPADMRLIAEARRIEEGDRYNLVTNELKREKSYD